MDDLNLPSSGWMFFSLLFILQHLSNEVSSMPYMGPCMAQLPFWCLPLVLNFSSGTPNVSCKISQRLYLVKGISVLPVSRLARPLVDLHRNMKWTSRCCTYTTWNNACSMPQFCINWLFSMLYSKWCSGSLHFSAGAHVPFSSVRVADP